MNIRLIANNNPIDPLGIMSLVSNTKADFDIKFIPGEAYDQDIKSYDIVGFSTITGSHLYHNEIAGQLKKINPSIKTIMGGPHPTFFPQPALNLEWIDYICIGEGIQAFNKWIHGIPTKNIIGKGQTFTGQLDPLVNLNLFNPPDRKLIYRDKIRANNPIKDFMGAFGCPYNCSYCFNHSYAKLYSGQPRLRYIDPDKYIYEIDECKHAFGMKLISLQEDTPIFNQEWFWAMTSELKKRIDIPYHCNVRCDLVNEPMVKHMKETGCTCVTFAIENGDYEYRKKYLHRTMSDEIIIRCADLFHKYGIKVRTQNILGLPGQDLSGDLKTLSLNVKCRPVMAWASLFQPFPNTDLSQKAIDLGEWSGSVDSIAQGYFNHSPLKLKDKEKRERLQKLFMIACNSRILRALLKILLYLPLPEAYSVLYSHYKNKKYKQFYGIKEC